MKPNRLDELFDAWSEGSLSHEDSLELNELLRNSVDARKHFRDASMMHGMLHAAATSLAVEKVASQQQSIPIVFNSYAMLPAMMRQASLGILIGLLVGGLGVSAVWAYSSTLIAATSQQLAALFDGGFENDSKTIGHGFPIRLGEWSGDDAAVVQRETDATPENKSALQFIAAKPDTAAVDGRAIACDLFQLVDLRSLRDRTDVRRDEVLELSADFLDDRHVNSNPSVSFFCQVYLFRGDPTAAHQNWPMTIGDSLSSGSAQITTLGGGDWKTATARCFVPDEADYAVVHIAAVPNLRVPMPERLLADNVRLNLKTQPVLPVRVLKRESP
jgi:hypothetical protein